MIIINNNDIFTKLINDLNSGLFDDNLKEVIDTKNKNLYYNFKLKTFKSVSYGYGFRSRYHINSLFFIEDFEADNIEHLKNIILTKISELTKDIISGEVLYIDGISPINIKEFESEYYEFKMSFFNAFKDLIFSTVENDDSKFEGDIKNLTVESFHHKDPIINLLLILSGELILEFLELSCDESPEYIFTLFDDLNVYNDNEIFDSIDHIINRILVMKIFFNNKEFDDIYIKVMSTCDDFHRETFNDSSRGLLPIL